MIKSKLAEVERERGWGIVEDGIEGEKMRGDG